MSMRNKLIPRYHLNQLMVMVALLLVGLLLGNASLPAAAQEPASSENLATRQQNIADNYRRFEEVLLRVAEQTAGEDPQRAALLRKVITESKDKLIGVRFQELSGLLEDERFSAAIQGQQELRDQLQQLLDLLMSEDRNKRIKEQKEQTKEYLEQVDRLIKEQRSLQGQTESNSGTQRLAEQQGRVAEQTGDLSQEMRQADSENASDEEADSAEGENSSDSDPSDEALPDKPGTEGNGGEYEQPSDLAPPAATPQNQPDDANDLAPGAQPSESSEAEESSAEGSPAEGQGKPGEAESSPAQPSGEQSQSGESQSGESQQGQAEQGNSEQEQAESAPDGQQAPQQSQQNPAAERLEAAQQRMREAQEKLEQAEREEASEAQEEALRELEQAKAELEEILRQLREEEMGRLLAMLEARFRKMLQTQTVINEGTLRLASVPAEQFKSADQIQAGRLSRQEEQLALDATAVIELLGEDGTAVAFPEAVLQMRDDMQQVTARLAQADVREITQGIQQDIVTALEEMITALEQAQQDLEDQQQEQQGQPGQGEQQGEPALIDQLAELKMIRALQMRVNNRTELYSKRLTDGRAVDAETLAALQELATREERIFQATRDIVVGRNK